MKLIFLIYLLLVINSAYGKQARIIGGTDTVRFRHPHQVIFKQISDGTIICGGAIISQKHILTAARCVDSNSIAITNIKINFGCFNRTHQFVREEKPYRIYTHPQYRNNFNNIEDFQNDIAVVLIYRQFHFNIYENKIQLPSKNIIPNATATITGWGSISYPSILYATILQKASMTLIKNDECGSRLPIKISKDQFCGYNSKGVGPCIGDIGGPLVHNGKVIGILSMSYFCAEDIPDIYTNVYLHIDFIIRAMNVI